jgi:hypothetical protein
MPVRARKAGHETTDTALDKGRDDVRAIRSVLRGPAVGGRAGAGGTTTSTTA